MEQGEKDFLRRRLREIFGKEAYAKLSPRAREAAETVVRWEEGVGDVRDDAKVVAEDKKKVAARVIWEVIRSDMGEEAKKISARCRERYITETRTIMFKVLYEVVFIPKSRLAKALGIPLEHPTIIYSLKKWGDLYATDAAFRYRYNYILKEVKGRLVKR